MKIITVLLLAIFLFADISYGQTIDTSFRAKIQIAAKINPLVAGFLAAKRKIPPVSKLAR